MDMTFNCKCYLVAVDKSLEEALISEIDTPTVTCEAVRSMWADTEYATKVRIEGYIDKTKKVFLSRPIKEISDEELVNLIMKEG